MKKPTVHMADRKTRTGHDAWTLCGISIGDLVPGFTRSGNISRNLWEWTDSWRGVTCKSCLRRKPRSK